jgi:hypothetical protein
MPQPTSSTLGSATPDHPTSSVSTSVQPQPQPQAQAQAPPQAQEFAFRQPGPYVLYAYPKYSYYPPPPISQLHTPNEQSGFK